MSEIEKLYINANVEKDWKALPYDGIDEFYPKFTAEKQIELIKWLSTKFYFFCVEHENDEFSCSNGILSGFKHKKLRESLADFTNEVWKFLTDTEKAEIKRILE